jgi:uroporphyrinogen III methyltransferase/synthase
MADGRTPETPAALILNPGQPGQHRVSAPLGELARKAATYGLRGDALLVLGPGVELAERLDTLSKRPLHGRRVLITRARHQVDPFRRELVDLGASVTRSQPSRSGRSMSGLNAISTFPDGPGDSPQRMPSTSSSECR